MTKSHLKKIYYPFFFFYFSLSLSLCLSYSLRVPQESVAAGIGDLPVPPANDINQSGQPRRRRTFEK